MFVGRSVPGRTNGSLTGHNHAQKVGTRPSFPTKHNVACSSQTTNTEASTSQTQASPEEALLATRSASPPPSVPAAAGPSSPMNLNRTQPAGPSSPLPRTSTSRPCRQCNGTRAVNTRVGLLPCPACAPWRQRVDYIPGRPLLSMRDLNLSSLESGANSIQTNPSSRRPRAKWEEEMMEDRKKASKAKKLAAEKELAEEQAAVKERKKVPMTEEKRRAIQKALQNRGPITTDHKRRISRSMRAAHAANPNLRQAGKPKKCGHCGEEGHNRKTCPQLLGPQEGRVLEQGDQEGARRVLNRMSGDLYSAASLATASASQGKQQQEAPQSTYTCSVCGELGHNKRSCPLAPPKEPKQPVKMIIIEEVDQVEVEGAAPVGAAVLPTVATRTSNATESSLMSIKQQQEDGTLPASGVPVIKEATAAEQSQSNAISTASEAPPVISQPTTTTAAAAVVVKIERERDPVLPGACSPAVQLLGPGVSISPDGGLIFPLPTRWEQSVQQAAAAVLRAWDDGIRRQTLELLLPQENSAADGGWPGGIRQQYRAALPLVEALLLRLKRAEGLQGRITGEWLDEGDCVGAWQNEHLAAVLFPTGDTLPDLQRIDDALSGQRLTMVLNPQWQPQGQVVSDFGFGRNKRRAERFISSYEDIYYLKRVRVLGDELRILKCYPGQWQVHYVRGPGQAKLLSCEDEKPTYERLIELLKSVSGSSASKSWIDRAFTKGAYDEYASYDGSSAKEFADPEDEGVERDIVTGEVVNSSKRAPSSGK